MSYQTLKDKKRWRKPDKDEALAIIDNGKSKLRIWKYVIVPIAVAVGILIGAGCVTSLRFIADRKATMLEYKAEINLIESIILKSNPGFERIYLTPTAKYIYDNAGKFDPIFLTLIGRWESMYKRNAVSPAGAEGIWMNMPCDKTRELTKSERLQIESQFERAKEKLLSYYQSGVSHIQGPVYAMHKGYLGVDKNFDELHKYIAFIHCDYAEAKGLIWRDKELQ
jgi:hypothetical protein